MRMGSIFRGRFRFSWGGLRGNGIVIRLPGLERQRVKARVR